MAKYTVKTRTDVVRENMALTNNAYGGWMAVNSGVDAVTVNGITLLPGEVLDFTKLSPDVIWDEPIKIVTNNTAGNQVTVTRLVYKEISRKEEKQWQQRES